MGYLSDEEAADAYEKAKAVSEVKAAIEAWEAAWSSEGLPPKELSADFLGPVFVPDPPEPLLPEDRRARAADPELWQLVHLGPVGLDVVTFDEKAPAECALAELEPDELGEGGGMLFRAREAVGERLFLRYMQRQDFADYLERATQPPPEPVLDQEALQLDAASRTMRERLESLALIAPEIGELKRKYDAEGPSDEPIYGRPSDALAEFARLFPGFVRLGGCMPPSCDE
mmetsp:Transcript_121230/g.354371  ORF Transcript_121230/g.354371 Transcript_121230/m.354371 type:complete len:229 (+) Transcript_121230:91-777(+)